jgi:hypothetical protein
VLINSKNKIIISLKFQKLLKDKRQLTFLAMRLDFEQVKRKKNIGVVDPKLFVFDPDQIGQKCWIRINLQKVPNPTLKFCFLFLKHGFSTPVSVSFHSLRKHNFQRKLEMARRIKIPIF